MSSIYQKGRDGYFYYQTYVKNPASGKKDKRIFHSLGTKDREKAETMQKDLDIKYNSFKKRNLSKKIYTIFTSNKYYFIYAFLVFIALSIYSFFYEKKEKAENNLQEIIKSIELESKDNNNIKTPEEILDSKDETQVTIDSTKLVQPLEKNKISPEALTNKTTLQTPYYTIQRIENLSGAFEQGKIFLTVNENTDKKILLSICEEVKYRYPKFQNLIICVYADTEIGNSIAEGLNQKFSTDENKKSWLAMYTYNPVEGVYFDENPGGYLGVY